MVSFQEVCFLEDTDRLERRYKLLNSKYCNMHRMKVSSYCPFRNQQQKLQKRSPVIFRSYNNHEIKIHLS